MSDQEFQSISLTCFCESYMIPEIEPTILRD